MKILFIGGTGTISMAITRLLAERGDELYLLNRGNRNAGLPENVKLINCDILFNGFISFYHCTF